MQRPIRTWLPIVLALAAVTALAPPSQAQQVLRSGTILGGMGYNDPAADCRDLPDCGAWVASGCSPSLTGRDPAAETSIVNVADLADGRTRRIFRFRAGDSGNVAGGVTVQFWFADCVEISSRRWRSWDSSTGRNRRRAAFSITTGAKWMTVAASDNLHIEWTLR